MVERKGIGHPDTVCDALAEATSRALCRHYLARFGRILHHNVDKVLLRAGLSRPGFGGGEVVAPVEIFLAGRATFAMGAEAVPVEDLAREACADWLRAHVPRLAPHVRLACIFRPGSGDLVDLYAEGLAGVPLSNDTSFGAGYAPLSPLERGVLAVARGLDAPDVAREAPALGTDVKIMGVRVGARTRLTVACALVDAFVADTDAYLRAKADASDRARRAAAGLLGEDVAIEVNVADDPARGRLYLTVTGSSAECGDDGEAGRGNRANGLITPYRPMTMESIAGKNPVTHVGKLYNVVARRIAEDAVAGCPDLVGVRVYLVNRIGRPLAAPDVVDIQAEPRPGVPFAPLRATLRALAASHLERLPALTAALVAGTIDVY